MEIAWHNGRLVLAGEKREYGHAKVHIKKHKGESPYVDKLFNGLGSEMDVYMSHGRKDFQEMFERCLMFRPFQGDKLSQVPQSFSTIASTTNAPLAAIAHNTEPYYAQRLDVIRFHPEVTHTPKGKELLRNFAVDICGARQHWAMDEFVPKEIARIRALVGEKAQVIGGVSGGVDSTVAAKLMHEAIGTRFHAILVDNGLLREREAETVQKTLSQDLGINLIVADARQLFLDALKGVIDPETKRKRIGRIFIEVFEEQKKILEDAAANTPNAGDIEWLVQGTLYPDVIESISYKGPSATIKTHHNVGGLPERMNLKLIEPLRELFKDEVRELGTKLGIPEQHIWRHPFPGPGLAIRILGEVTESQLRIARHADRIFIEEIVSGGHYRDISQAFAALLPVRAVGVVGDRRVYSQVISLRAVETTDFMTADFWYPPKDFIKKVSLRITNEVDGVARVVYDMTSKPPGTIEMM
ncbi:GMP synthase (glutamine-hydrolyzing) [Lecanora helva]